MGTAFIFVLLGITFSWFGSSLYALLDTDGLMRDWGWAPFLALVGMAGFWARKAGGEIHVSVHQNDCPAKVRGLILFLSLPGRGKTLEDLQAKVAAGTSARIDNQFEMPSGSWQMPLEAIDYHCGRLQYVVVIPSANTPDKDEQDGTIHHVDLFEATVKRMRQAAGVTCLRLPDKYGDGVDFEDARALVAAVEAAYAVLHDQGIDRDNAVVDITGGTKVATVAGAAGALADDRRFQYVSTRDYRVRSYDITYTA